MFAEDLGEVFFGRGHGGYGVEDAVAFFYEGVAGGWRGFGREVFAVAHGGFPSWLGLRESLFELGGGWGFVAGGVDGGDGVGVALAGDGGGVAVGGAGEWGGVQAGGWC